VTTPTLLLDAVTLRTRLGGPEAPRMLDVRTPAEFETAHIPGSYNVPLETLREHRAELLGHLDEQVVLVCRSGRRAVQAEGALAEAGLPNLRVLDGGMLAWQASGAPVTRGRPRWELERQVRLVAAALGAGLAVAAVTDTCAMGALLAKLPYNRGPRQDITTVLARLGGAGWAS